MSEVQEDSDNSKMIIVVDYCINTTRGQEDKDVIQDYTNAKILNGH